MAFSPDGSLFAASTPLGIYVFDSASMGEVSFIEPEVESTNILFSPDNTLLATWHDTDLQLWKLNDGQLLHTLTGHTDDIQVIAFSPDNTSIASGASDNSVRVWRILDGKLLTTFSEQSSWVTSLSYNPSGNELAAGFLASTINIWDLESYELVDELKGHSSIISCLTYSHEGDLLVSTSADNSSALWRDGQKVNSFDSEYSLGACPVFSSDDSSLALKIGENEVSIWKIENGIAVQPSDLMLEDTERFTFTKENNFIGISSGGNVTEVDIESGSSDIQIGCENEKTVTDILLSPSGEFVALLSSDNNIIFCPLNRGSMVDLPFGLVDRIARTEFLGGSEFLVGFTGYYSINDPRYSYNYLSDPRYLAIWDLANGNLIQSTINDNANQFSFFSLSKENNLIAALKYDALPNQTGELKKIDIWQLHEGQLMLLRSFDSDSWVSGVISPDGTQLAVVHASDAGDKVQILNVSNQRVELEIPVNGEVSNLLFSPDGRQLSAYVKPADGDNFLDIIGWNVDDGSVRYLIDSNYSNRYYGWGNFSPDSSRFLISHYYQASGDTDIELRSSDNGRILLRLGQGGGAVFSPDGNIIATSRTNKIYLWRTTDGQLLNTLDGHTGAINKMAFSPDGSLLASGSNDDSIRIWSVENGDLLQTLLGGADDVTDIRFSSDGIWFVSCSADTTVKMWGVPPN